VSDTRSPGEREKAPHKERQKKPDLAGLSPEAPKLKEDLDRYVRELKLWNPRLGLIEARDEEIFPKHIWDCLAALPVFRQVTAAAGPVDPAGPGGPGDPLRIADLGSGAGLPGLVLSLALPTSPGGRPIRWVLVEKSGRRVNFLRNCAALFPQAPVDILPSSFEALPTESFDILTNRAFQPLTPQTFSDQVRLVKPGGWILWYKAKYESLVQEAQALGRNIRVIGSYTEAQELDFSVDLGAWPLQVPGLQAERHLVLWKKSSGDARG